MVSTQMVVPQRLLVLAPSQPLDEMKLVQQIVGVADLHHLPVLLLTVIENPQAEMGAQLRLENLSSMIRARSIDCQKQLIVGGGWLVGVLAVWQTGDQVICHAEQSFTGRDQQRQALSAVLSSALKEPVIVFSGCYTETPVLPRTILAEIYWWGTASLVLGLGTGAQVWISQAFQSSGKTVLLVLTFLVEITVLLIWHQVN